LGLQEEFKKLDTTIGALLGTRKARLSTPAATARAAGKPYDNERVGLFETLAIELQRDSLHAPPADPRADSKLSFHDSLTAAEPVTSTIANDAALG